MSERWYPGKFIEKVRGKPILSGLWSPVIYPPVDREIEAMREAKKAEWRRMGYSESLIRMAEDLADDWASSIAAAFAPPELRASIIRHMYPKALDVASRWLAVMGK